MPKMKSHSAAKKRFKKVGFRKIKRAQGYRRHLLTKKTTKRKRDLRRTAYISPVDVIHILRLLPY